MKRKELDEVKRRLFQRKRRSKHQKTKRIRSGENHVRQMEEDIKNLQLVMHKLAREQRCSNGVRAESLRQCALISATTKAAS